MGRPKVFLQLFDDLVAKHKSTAAAEKEYKTYMLLAKEQGLRKDYKLSDIKHRGPNDVLHDRPSKKQRVVEPDGVSMSEKELYERLVEAECLRAESEKQRGDDLSKIAMMLASGKGGDIIPQAPPALADKSPSKIPEPDHRD